MRGFVVERRTLVAAVTQRARGPSRTRSYSAGIGRGRGEGFGSYEDTEESVFSASFGHGTPLNSGVAGRGRGRGHINPVHGAPSTNIGRGLDIQDRTGTGGAHSGPLLPNISHDGDSPSQRLGASDHKSPTTPSLNFGSAGFGRGKPPQEKAAVPEEIFSSNRSALSSWSTWDEKLNKRDKKDGPSPAELRLMEEQGSTTLRAPAVAQQPRGSSEERQRHGRQPSHATNLDARVQPQGFPFAAASAGWQQPIQQDARLQMQPPMRHPPASTGGQQSEGMGDPYVNKQTFPPGIPLGKHQNTREGSMDRPSHAARNVAQKGMASYPFTQETGQSQFADTNQQTHAKSDWYASASKSTEPLFPSRSFSESDQGQYVHGNKGAPSASVAPGTDSGVSSVEYDWGPQTSKSFQDSKEQLQVEASLHGANYEGRIEECFKAGKLEDIDGIYNQMKAAQVQVSAKTYGTLLQSYMQLGKMDKVSAIYQEMSGVLFSQKSSEGDQAKGVFPAADARDSRQLPIEDMSSAAHGAAHGAEFKEKVGPAPLPDNDEKDTPPFVSGRNTQGFASPERPESSIATGMGRGKKLDSFFNFDFSGGFGSGGVMGHETKSSENQGSYLDKQDDYSQTFTPVIEPGWYAFAPQGISVGPGAGRGRPHSPQVRDPKAGSSMSMPSPSQRSLSEAGQGRSSYEQRMQVALQQSPPLYAMDENTEVQYDYPEELSQPSIATEEAAERAMSILNRSAFSGSRRQRIFEEYPEEARPTPTRRAPVQRRLVKSLEEKRQPKARVKLEKKSHLTDEEAKKEAEELRAIQESETLQELQHTVEQFMKCYGEMALEPEHELGDFTNPDLEEKPFMSLEQYLDKAKPNIMKTGLIRSEKEWRNMVNQTLKHAPYFEEFVESYSGPGRYTAKQENEDLEEIASTLPTDVEEGTKAFVQRSLTTLKSNPGFNLDEKQWMLAMMVDEFSEYSVET